MEGQFAYGRFTTGVNNNRTNSLAVFVVTFWLRRRGQTAPYKRRQGFNPCRTSSVLNVGLVLVFHSQLGDLRSVTDEPRYRNVGLYDTMFRRLTRQFLRRKELPHAKLRRDYIRLTAGGSGPSVEEIGEGQGVRELVVEAETYRHAVAGKEGNFDSDGKLGKSLVVELQCEEFVHAVRVRVIENTREVAVGLS